MKETNTLKYFQLLLAESKIRPYASNVEYNECERTILTDGAIHAKQPTELTTHTRVTTIHSTRINNQSANI